LKFHDIPNTVAGACRAAASYGIDLLTVHSTAGRNALKAAKIAIEEGAKSTGVKPPQLIAITLLTSLSSRDLAFDLKVPLELPEYALNMALLAQECGLDGAVCSPQEITPIRANVPDDFILVCPGIRPTWAEAKDQKRTLTPKEAIALGATYLVIGRPITASPNPAESWQKICAEIG
jgi:orotidine-5'-phosphate decarboxylase